MVFSFGSDQLVKFDQPWACGLCVSVAQERKRQQAVTSLRCLFIRPIPSHCSGLLLFSWSVPGLLPPYLWSWRQRKSPEGYKICRTNPKFRSAFVRRTTGTGKWGTAAGKSRAAEQRGTGLHSNGNENRDRTWGELWWLKNRKRQT